MKTRIACFYCDRPVVFEAALITPYGKLCCAECYLEMHYKLEDTRP